MATKTAAGEAPNPYARAGEEVHFMATITLHTSDTGVGGGGICNRGDSLVLTDTLLRLNPIFQLLGDEDAQLDRYRRVIVVPGGWPGGLASLPGSRERFEEREVARQAAWSEPDAATRKAALAAVDRTYGPGPTTSTEIGSYRGGR